MEQQSKYYTPDISELYVGYECEIGTSWGFSKGKFPEVLTYDTLTGFAIQKATDLMDVFRAGSLRTKYLDQSDIESCGWIKDWDENSNYSDCYKLLTKSDINGQSDDEWVLWQYDKIVSISNELSNRCFDGECKSINELRKIMEWLNIK
jgi:hypothetical protein